MSEWISVLEKLPPKGKYFLCASKGRKVAAVMRRFGTKEKPIYQGYDCLEISEVTHWMPLPEMPNER